ncbi:protein kinase [Rhodococcus sp. T2V]|uniref:serine/threonine-protein kinase n=1 Tax=Rhodococcus sp. T2V TaxID=3034164 RepID=UPI0023E1AA85|nr:serine/threonine-protein kinase [Rhodococcus sp. T2V]MDF3308877.1 protein kinase [Rhodococcus sp. T2V]
MQGGALFGRYRLDRPLSVDGTGEVWAAFDTVTSRHVTVRALPPDATEDDEYRARFERDAGIVAHIRNPHVLPVHDFGQIGNRLFLATPITPGTTLRTMLRSTGAMEVPRAVGVVEQLASALDAVRAAGLVEPAVASANVLVQDGGLIQLTDVGLPTPRGAASGVYGLTAVLYECLTGTLFPSWSGTELAPRPSSVIARVPVGLDAVIARGTAVEPARRYRSAGELAAAARAAATPPEPAATLAPAAPPQPAAGLTPARVPVDWGRGVLVAGLALAAILAVVGGVILGSGSYSPDVAGPAPVVSAARPASPPSATAPTAVTNPAAAGRARSVQTPPQTDTQTETQLADDPALQEAAPRTPTPQSAPQSPPGPASAPGGVVPQVLPCDPGYEHTPPPDGPCWAPGSAPAPAPVAPQVLPCDPGYEHTPPPDGPCWAPAIERGATGDGRYR